MNHVQVSLNQLRALRAMRDATLAETTTSRFAKHDLANPDHPSHKPGLEADAATKHAMETSRTPSMTADQHRNAASLHRKASAMHHAIMTGPGAAHGNFAHRRDIDHHDDIATAHENIALHQEKLAHLQRNYAHVTR